MKLIITRSALLSALQVVKATTKQNVILPVNEFAKLVGKDGKLTLSTTNMQESIVRTIDYDGEDITMLLPVNWFIEFLKELPEQPLIIELVDSLLKIHATGEYEIATENEADFPKIPEVKKADFNIHAMSLKAALFATSEDELRPAFTGVIVTDKCIRATDAYVLYSKSHSGYTGKPAIFPKRILSLLPDSGLDVYVNKNQICFFNDTTQYHSLLIDEKIPPIDNIIPRDNNIIVEVDRTFLISSLKRVKLFSSFINQVILDISNNEITITSQDTTLARSGKEVVDCSLIGEPIKIGFEVNNLLRVLVNMAGDTAFLYLSRPNTAVILRSQNEPDNLEDLFIIVPSAIGSV